MTRNVRSYDHFCVLSRALERIGDRWTLLVIRDLLSGRKRFTDLMDRLGGITPKTLTQRLRELEQDGVVVADREPGRREVWYRLTDAGADLAPAIDALTWWGVRHAWRPPGRDEALHAEHLLMAATQVIDRIGGDPAPVRWHLELEDDGDYIIESDGGRWTLGNRRPDEPADVTIRTTTAALKQFVTEPTPERASALGIQISGGAAAVARFHRLFWTFREAVTFHPSDRTSQPAR
jgi:DNA-binding HxlR family transcriptional regulator